MLLVLRTPQFRSILSDLSFPSAAAGAGDPLTEAPSLQASSICAEQSFQLSAAPCINNEIFSVEKESKRERSLDLMHGTNMTCLTGAIQRRRYQATTFSSAIDSGLWGWTVASLDTKRCIQTRSEFTYSLYE